MTKPLTIVYITRHGCIRCQKEAIPLINKGYEIHCFANKIPMFGEHYKTLSIYQDIAQLENCIKVHSDADIFHCHNEPSWFVSAVKSILPNKPIVIDIHDSMLIRIRPEDEDHVRISVDERNNFQLADALVFPSTPMRDLICNEFKLSQPSIVLPSYVPRHLYRADAWRWLGGVVYEGRVDLPEDLSKDMEFFSYCDYTELAKQFKEGGIQFHLYTPRKDEKIKQHYKELAHWRGAYPFNELIGKLIRHDWGLLGNITEHMAWEYAMPNKLFEYIAAGIPIIAMNAKVAGEFVEKHGLGISVSSVDEIKARWKEHRQFRRNVAEHKYDWCMENHISVLEDLYRGLV